MLSELYEKLGYPTLKTLWDVVKEIDPTMTKASVKEFIEKPEGDGGWINGGFFVLEPSVFGYIEGDSMIWEKEPLQSLAAEGQLLAFQHRDFWQPMDTLRDKQLLEELWQSGIAPWKTW
jgi:glucose-1-phosphate cytidylyltransferase